MYEHLMGHARVFWPLANGCLLQLTTPPHTRTAQPAAPPARGARHRSAAAASGGGGGGARQDRAVGAAARAADAPSHASRDGAKRPRDEETVEQPTSEGEGGGGEGGGEGESSPSAVSRATDSRSATRNGQYKGAVGPATRFLGGCQRQ